MGMLLDSVRKFCYKHNLACFDDQRFSGRLVNVLESTFNIDQLQ